MEGSFYIIVVVAIFIKLMIWGCIIYSRNQRRARMAQLAQQQGGIIIIQDGSGAIIPQNDIRDRDFIISNENFAGYNQGVDNPQVMGAAPPSYDEVVQHKAMETKPPSYEQVVQTTEPSSPPHGQ